MEIEKVIYETGKTNIQTSVYSDEKGIERCAYSGSLNGLPIDMTVDEYLTNNENKNLSCVPFELALEQIRQEKEKAYIKQWIEISEEQYDEMLNVLPPEKWQTVDGVNFFRISEHLTSNITAHYAQILGHYFTANRRTSTPYQSLAAEVKELMKVA